MDLLPKLGHLDPLWNSSVSVKGPLVRVHSSEGSTTSSCYQSLELLGFTASLKIYLISFTVSSESFSSTFFFHFQLHPSDLKKNSAKANKWHNHSLKVSGERQDGLGRQRGVSGWGWGVWLETQVPSLCLRLLTLKSMVWGPAASAPGGRLELNLRPHPGPLRSQLILCWSTSWERLRLKEIKAPTASLWWDSGPCRSHHAWEETERWEMDANKKI